MPRRSEGTLIVFEGPDGTGKTALAGRYASWLREKGVAAACLSFPGHEQGSLGRVVYDLHHDPAKFGIVALTAESLQALHVAAHLDAIDRYIRPLLSSGGTVVLDRFWWSTWVYGIDSGANRETLDALVASERQHWGPVIPDVVVLLTREDSLKPEDAGPRWARRLALYQILAEREGSQYPIRIVPNDSTEDDVLDCIVGAISQSLAPSTSSDDCSPTNPHL